MFTRIRARLTLGYAALMIVILVAFTGITYGLLHSILQQEERQEMKLMLSRVADQQLTEMKRRARLRGPNDVTVEQKRERRYAPLHGGAEGERDAAGSGYTDYAAKGNDDGKFDDDAGGAKRGVNRFVFLLTLDERGTVLRSVDEYPALRRQIMETVQQWRPAAFETRDVHFSEGDGGELHILLGAQPVFDHGRFAGVVYAGMDVSDSRHVLYRLLFVLGVLSILFLLLAAGAGYYMAGRAMVPIIHSFHRQREFVADASHELRTPLSILQSSIDVIEADDARNLSEFSRQVLADMKDEVGRMTRLVGDLLTLARADSGKLELQRESFDLRPVAEQLFRTFQHRAKAQGLTMEMEGPPTLPVFVDRERITQLLCILLDNAVKYTPEGGKVSLSLARSGGGHNDTLQVKVQDTGIGISAEDQQHIFERFYRADKGRSRQAGGVGLGLSIARWIVEAHGGTIRVESAPGKGSSFIVIVPAALPR
ncbi:signal transduction histidine kinase, putative [Heliomicrobium modesticaldum Ice1]|uniref:histidine kinase n=1 Tax=Heliobacterium modesticaldum (strain ATCC 51547 / Ice1) TaxID=498761 RepID=B0TD67_HELMI|nr:ATP-binding protein [Heliomicrobium modesticaldum]ABZ84108.1 signal transduction histidine kinase, putative [Heliomicrobium modesticaldum Ice1]